MVNKPNLDPSPELAYVLGAFYGDGNLHFHHPHHYMIRFRVCDEEFAKEFNKNVCKVLQKNRLYAISFKDSRRPHWRGTFRVYVGSKQLYVFLKTGHDEIAVAYPTEFLRGLFDAEGDVNPTAIRLSNTNERLILLAQRLLSGLGIPSTIGTEKSAHKDKFRLKIPIGNYAAFSEFAKTVNFTISRKRAKVNHLLERIEAKKWKWDKRLLEKNIIESYNGEKMSLRKVAKKLGCTSGTIGNYMIKFDIPMRNKSAAQKNRHKVLEALA